MIFKYDEEVTEEVGISSNSLVATIYVKSLNIWFMLIFLKFDSYFGLLVMIFTNTAFNFSIKTDSGVFKAKKKTSECEQFK